MANYFVPLAAVAALVGTACSAAEPPAPKPAAAPAPATAPATPPAGAAQGGARVTAAPAGTSSSAGQVPHYRQATGGNLTFSFVQAGAENHGSFRQFTTELTYDEKNPATGKLEVTVQIASLDTQDKDRNDTLAGPDLFDVKKFPTARYSAISFAKRTNGGLEAVGKLTLHGVTKDLRVPLTIRPAGGGLELAGEVTIKRLAFGIGQGDWKSTEWVGDDVKVQYRVPVSRSN